MISHNEKAREIIRANRYMILPTSAGGETWAAPVAYAYDDQFNFYSGFIDSCLTRFTSAISITSLSIDGSRKN